MARLSGDLEQRVSRLQALWPCRIELTIEPPDLSTSVTAASNIGHMVAEAVSNAVRHGEATQVIIRLSERDDCIALTIRDNGRGFKSLVAPGEEGVGRIRKGGPLSLRSRVDDLGGRFFLESSDEGTLLTMELPA